MAFLQLTGNQLDDLGYHSIESRFILFPRGKTHVRLDQVRFPSGNLSVQIDGVWNYRITSFHVKIDATHDVTVQKVKVQKGVHAKTGKPLFKMKKVKTIDDWSDYLYFRYVDGGVWQPVWGYAKFASQTGGQVTNTYRSDLPSSYWGDLMAMGRDFIDDLSSVTPVPQNIACGPVPESSVNVNLFG